MRDYTATDLEKYLEIFAAIERYNRRTAHYIVCLAQKVGMRGEWDAEEYAEHITGWDNRECNFSVLISLPWFWWSGHSRWPGLEETRAPHSILSVNFHGLLFEQRQSDKKWAFKGNSQSLEFHEAFPFLQEHQARFWEQLEPRLRKNRTTHFKFILGRRQFYAFLKAYLSWWKTHRR